MDVVGGGGGGGDGKVRAVKCKQPVEKNVERGDLKEGMVWVVWLQKKKGGRRKGCWK